jgi:hypothetical protein
VFLVLNGLENMFFELKTHNFYFAATVRLVDNTSFALLVDVLYAYFLKQKISNNKLSTLLDEKKKLRLSSLGLKTHTYGLFLSKARIGPFFALFGCFFFLGLHLNL